MQRQAAMIRLKASHAEGYRHLHQQLWPAVADALRAANYTNYSIFERDGVLFSYVEYTGSDYDTDSATLAADPNVRAWWALTDECQEPLDSIETGQWWAPCQEVFHLD